MRPSNEPGGVADRADSRTVRNCRRGTAHRTHPGTGNTDAGMKAYQLSYSALRKNPNRARPLVAWTFRGKSKTTSDQQARARTVSLKSSACEQSAVVWAAPATIGRKEELTYGERPHLRHDGGRSDGS